MMMNMIDQEVLEPKFAKLEKKTHKKSRVQMDLSYQVKPR